MSSGARLDLVCLVADRDMHQTMEGLLTRRESLGIRPIRHELPVHPLRDPGCLKGAPDFLRIFLRRAAHALVIFDHEGGGREATARHELEAELEARLRQEGWEERAAAVIIAPELESWIWSDSPEVSPALGWTGRPLDLHAWLRQQGFLEERQIKPARPKEALEATLRTVRRPRSSALYRKLASKVGLGRCTDPAFAKLKQVLRCWFGENAPMPPVGS